jgi:hypothetical protein
MPCAWLTGLHQTIAGTQVGGIGPGLSPRQALSLVLKVDQDAIPLALILELKQGRLNLDDPAVTLELLRHNAVLGLTNRFFWLSGQTTVGRDSMCGVPFNGGQCRRIRDRSSTGRVGKPRFKRRRYH